MMTVKLFTEYFLRIRQYPAQSVLLAFILSCCSSWLLGEERRPEPPSIIRDVALIDENIQFTHPMIPGNRTSQDGRVSLVVEGGTFNADTYIFRNFLFYLNVPEAVDEPIMTGSAGAKILNGNSAFLVPVPNEIPVGFEGMSFNFHHTICDATEEFFREGEKPNPYTCGKDGKNDCYDITLITSTALLARAQLWGTPARIEVANPKTVDAKIINITLGEPIAGAVLPLSGNLNEPAITEDGRLLSGRRGPIRRFWKNPETGDLRFEGHELVYSQLDDNAKPCDVRGWQNFHPVSHAPYDSRMKGRYGIAAHPFRDGEGNIIADGEDVGGTYPWMDRQGANIFMSGIAGRLSEEDRKRYPRRCAQADVVCDNFEQSIDFDRGQMVAGLWTHGKFVLLDAMVNSIDWTVGVAPRTHYEVDLYRNTQGEDVSIRVGGGRYIEALRAELLPYPLGYTFNANILDSVQNIFNYHENLRTVTPRDVVWLMSNGVVTDEVAFDDFLDPNALIISNMQASISRGPKNWLGSHTPYYHDGVVRKLKLGMMGKPLYTPEREEVHIQNAATSPLWKVPSFALIEKNTARVEPVALGGIKGKGLWLNGSDKVLYRIPEQDNKKINEHDWYISLFLDARFEKNEAMVLFSFPDNSELHLQKEQAQQSLHYWKNNHLLKKIILPVEQAEWQHLALQVSEKGKRIELLVNGFSWDNSYFDVALFQPIAGDLLLGNGIQKNEAGFRGWLDDFKIFAYLPNAEVACNHARGTLIAVADNTDWQKRAKIYPDWAHKKITAQLRDSKLKKELYACFHDYQSDWGANLAVIPKGSLMLRENINFPEGPLRFGQPRPDSSANQFCLSCHTAAGKGTMGLAALQFNADLTVENDFRRQPAQPPRRVFGNIPDNWLNNISNTVMNQRKRKPESNGEMEATLIDTLLLPD